MAQGGRRVYSPKHECVCSEDVCVWDDVTNTICWCYGEICRAEIWRRSGGSCGDPAVIQLISGEDPVAVINEMENSSNPAMWLSHY